MYEILMQNVSSSYLLPLLHTKDYFTGNVAAGSADMGIWFEDLPNADPIYAFRDNTMHSNIGEGLNRESCKLLENFPLLSYLTHPFSISAWLLATQHSIL